MEREILLLGDPVLYETSTEVTREELARLVPVVDDLHDTLMAYRAKYGAGRAIAAPQIGVKKRLIYMNTGTPVAFINPVLRFPDDEMMDVMDDCMSFPGLIVRVRRHIRCTVEYLDMDWKARSITFKGDLSELIQHEYDHLDGILATMRAADDKSLYYGKQFAFLK